MNGVLRIVGLFLFLFEVVSCIECSKHNVLNKYKISERSILGSKSSDTPPSVKSETWYMNLCDENTNKETIPDECNGKDIFCGVTTVSLPGKDTVTTEIIDFLPSVAFSVEEQDALKVNLRGASWGTHTLDAEVLIKCDEKRADDIVETSSWMGSEIHLEIIGPSGCLKTDNGPGKPDDDRPDEGADGPHPKGGAGLGSWLVWLLMYSVIFALIYLVAVSYMNTRGGSFADFRDEFSERVTVLATNLPQFAREVAGKIINTGSTSQRGGYSAV